MRLINSSAWCEHVSLNVNHYSVKGCQLSNCVSVVNKNNEVYWADLTGGYAEVFYNKDTKVITLVRDHMGIEPLYYYHQNGVFVFGSNLPDVIAKLPGKPAYNYHQLVNLVTLHREYTDETYHQYIYRAEPGCIMTISPAGHVSKQRFWQLDPDGADIELANDAAYLDRFSELMHESVAYNTQGEANRLCGKMSGGLDSGSIFIATNKLGLSYPLYMHIASAGGTLVDDRSTACAVLDDFDHAGIHYVGADEFDPIAEFEYCADLFAGPAPYVLFMHMLHLYRKVVLSGHSVILSGAGGDNCVSGHAYNNNYLRSRFKSRGLKDLYSAIAEMDSSNINSRFSIKRLATLVRIALPAVYNFVAVTIGVEAFLRMVVNKKNDECGGVKKIHMKTVREREWDMIQGPNSQPLRMRVEYNAVLAKAMGFEFRYPLLYPKLVEYCLALPLNQKRRDGVARYIMRQYLKKEGAPKVLYEQTDKQGGIIPGTLDKCYDWLKSGKFSQHFSDLPYMQYANTSTLHQELTQKTLMYMLKHVQ